MNEKPFEGLITRMSGSSPETEPAAELPTEVAEAATAVIHALFHSDEMKAMEGEMHHTIWSGFMDKVLAALADPELNLSTYEPSKIDPAAHLETIFEAMRASETKETVWLRLEGAINAASIVQSEQIIPDDSVLQNSWRLSLKRDGTPPIMRAVHKFLEACEKQVSEGGQA